MTKMQRCASGKHHFDADKYAVCPHCAPTRMTLPSASAVEASKPETPAIDDPDKTRLMPPRAERTRFANKTPGVEPKVADEILTVLPDNTRRQPSAILPKNWREGLPAVGWLIVVAGAGEEWERRWLGRDFTLVPGSNRIGVGEENEISLNIEDPAISEDCHCILTYDPESNKYFLQNGSGRHLTHLKKSISDGEIEDTSSKESQWAVILSPTELIPNSIIRVGKTQLRFLPLCGSNFRWKFLS